MDNRLWAPRRRDDLAEVSEAVLRWSRAAADSPLYEFLARRIAEDARMLDVVSRIERTPPLNLLFGSVRVALTPDDALAAWYPVLVGDSARAPDDELWDAFRTYVLDRSDALLAQCHLRRTQTNEAGRSSAVMPWIAEAQRLWGEPVHLVDIGTSAGLNLCLDRFDHDYGTHVVPAALPASTRLTLHCDNRSALPLPAAAPELASRTGLDLNPLDATDPDQAAWLEALVWPEHVDRLQTLRRALAIRRETDITLVAGDAVETIPTLHELLPPGPIVLMHTVMAYQLTAEQQAGLDASVIELSRRRRLARVGMEPAGPPTHTAIRTGLTRPSSHVRATAHAHGRWLMAPSA